MQKKRDTKRGVFSGGQSADFDDLRRFLTGHTIAVCGVCRSETRALRQCRDCGLVFCPLCLTKEYNAQGQVTEVYPQCPRCRSENLTPADAVS